MECVLVELVSKSEITCFLVRAFFKPLNHGCFGGGGFYIWIGLNPWIEPRNHDHYLDTDQHREFGGLCIVASDPQPPRRLHLPKQNYRSLTFCIRFIALPAQLGFLGSVEPGPSKSLTDGRRGSMWGVCLSFSP